MAIHKYLTFFFIEKKYPVYVSIILCIIICIGRIKLEYIHELKKKTSTSLCKHLDICWFSIVKTVAPGRFLTHTKSFKIWYRCIFIGTVVWYLLACELRCSLCYLTISSYKKSSMYILRKFGEHFENHSILFLIC